MKKILLSNATIGSALTLLVLSLFYLQVPFFENMELMFYDLRAQLRQKPQAAQNGEVAIVAIDEESIAKLNRWPWPRWRMAELLEKLGRAEPKVIAFNLLFSEPENNQGLEEVRNLQGTYGGLLLSKKIKEPKDYSFLAELSSAEVRLDNDTKFANAIRDAHNVLLAMSFNLETTPGAAPPEMGAEELPFALALSSAGIQETQGASLPLPLEAADAILPLDEFTEGTLGAGHVTVLPDRDGILRREVPFIKYAGKLYPSLAFQAARCYLGLPLSDIQVQWGRSIRMGKAVIPLDSENQMAVSYLGPAQTFPYYSFYDVVNDKVQPAAFKNKIVLVAFTAAGLGSLHATPIGHNVPGAEYIASIIQNILKQNFIARPPWAFKAELAGLILVGLFITLLLPRLKAGIGFGASVALGALLIAPASYLFTRDGIWIKVFYPFFLLVAGYIVMISKQFFTTEKKKELVEASEIETNKMLGLSFQGQGQLDLAFEKFRKCPMDDGMKDLLYNLGLDFERKRQFNKAVAVYETVGKTDPKFKDIETKIDLLKKAADGAVFGGSLGGAKGGKEGGTVMLDNAALRPTLGRYEIQKELGRGAMGVVYLGKDPKINRTVAIKTMMFDGDVDEKTLKDLKERFFREAESAGGLSHPNIVKIYDAGEDQDMAYIAMELMEGEDLKNYGAKDKLLPIPKVLEYISKVADALDYAHQQGVTHRDIKPANIMLLKDGTIRVADFGIARIQGSSKTATGTVLGTPSYMSPEQVAGKKVDGRSDLFSLGVTLFELLTGEKPFKGGEAIGTLLFQIANDPHPDPRSVRPEVPEAAAAVIARALEKDPEKRYQRGAEMGLDLKNCLIKMTGPGA